MLLMVLDGFTGLDSEGQSFTQRTLMGMLDEAIAGDINTIDRYRQMTEGKMVSYGMLLYSPFVNCFDAIVRPQLSKFLKHSFYVAQMINDLHDQQRDLQRNQVNIWSLPLDRGLIVEYFVTEVMELSASCATMDEPVSNYSHARVTDLANYALQIIEGAPAAA
jgi:hypothetical protein